MTYAELQQRRQRIDAAIDAETPEGKCRLPDLIRALLDDADPSAHFVLGSTAFSAALPMYDRALSIAEKELGL